MQSNNAEFNAIEASLEQIKYNLKLIQGDRKNDYNILTEKLEDFEKRIKYLEEVVKEYVNADKRFS